MKQLSWLSGHNYPVLIEHLQDGIFVIENEKFIFVNQGLSDILGYPADELIGRAFIDFIADEDKPVVLARHRARLSGEKVPEIYDLHIITKRGETICCSLNAGLSKNPAGESVAIGSLRDVTQQRALQAELHASREELKSIFDNLPDIFYRTDMDGIIIKVSPSCFNVTGYRQEELLGTPLSNYYKYPDERQKVVQAIVAGGGKATRVEAVLKHKSGASVWISTSAVVRLGVDGQPLFIEGMARDVSEHKRLESQLLALSRTDGLTGIYNRGYFMEKAAEAINMMRRYQRQASLMIADLDHFKTINDGYGHHAGDLALKAFTNACRQEIRESDIMGRLGGEEFCLLLPETPIPHAQILAERIRNATDSLNIYLDEQIIRITVSIGLVELRPEDTSLDSLLRRADLAMYQAKSKGRNQVITSI